MKILILIILLSSCIDSLNSLNIKNKMNPTKLKLSWNQKISYFKTLNTGKKYHEFLLKNTGEKVISDVNIKLGNGKDFKVTKTNCKKILKPNTECFVRVMYQGKTSSKKISFISAESNGKKKDIILYAQTFFENNKPVVKSMFVFLDESTSLSSFFMGADSDSDELTYSILDKSSDIKVTKLGRNEFKVVPNKGYYGSTSFSYQASDGKYQSNIAVVHVVVKKKNRAPKLDQKLFTTTRNTDLTIQLPYLDSDGDKIFYSLGSKDENGIFTLSDEHLKYTPLTNFVGLVSVSINMKDSKGLVSSDVIKINVENSSLGSEDLLGVGPVLDNKESVAYTNQTYSYSNQINSSFVPYNSGDIQTYRRTKPSQNNSSNDKNNASFASYKEQSPIVTYVGSVIKRDVASTQSTQTQIISSPVIVTSTVYSSAKNNAPVGLDASFSTNKNVKLLLSLVGSDPEGSAVSFSTTSTSNGVLSVISSNSFSYMPNKDYVGSDSFTYTVTDGLNTSVSYKISITVHYINHKPSGSNGNYTQIEDQSSVIVLSGSDVDGDVLSYTSTVPSNGTLTGTPPNLTYNPNLNYNGIDSFTYTVSDGSLSSTYNINLSISAFNDKPTTTALSLVTNEDSSSSIVLNGFDVDGDSLIYSVVSNPANGTLGGVAPNLTYTPNLNYNGTDSFTFKVNDGIVDSNVSTVSITVNAVNDAPVTTNKTLVTNEDTNLGIDLSAYASDVDGDNLAFIVMSGPSNGSLSGSGSNPTYTPNLNYNGTDSFTFKVNDGTVDSNVSTVTLTVNAVNDAPVSSNVVQSVAFYNHSIQINLAATDVEGDALSYSITNLPEGVQSVSGNVLTYTLNSSSSVPKTVILYYIANDGLVDSNVSTVSIDLVKATRVTRGIQTQYIFRNSIGNVILDEVALPLNLKTSDKTKILPYSTGATISLGETITSVNSESKISTAINSSQEFSIEIYLKDTSLSDFSLVSINPLEFKLSKVGGQIEFTSDGGVTSVSDNAIQGSLYHIVVTQDATSLDLYIDGKNVQSFSNPSALSLNPGFLKILDPLFSGDVVYVGIHSVKLSQVEVLHNYYDVVKARLFKNPTNNVTCLGSETAFDSYGSGSLINPFLICTPVQLSDFNQNGNPSDNLILGSNLDMTGTQVIIPLYTGIFDGANYEIYNYNPIGTVLNRYATSGNQRNALFSVVDGGTIKNLNISGIVSGGKGTSLLIGKLTNSGTIQNITVTGHVSSSLTRTGGALGECKNSTVSNVVSTISIESTDINGGGVVGKSDTCSYTNITTHGLILSNGSSGQFLGLDVGENTLSTTFSDLDVF